MRRREFVAGIGIAAIAPHVASAQQRNMPVIGVVFSGRDGEPGPTRTLVGYRRGLAEMGYLEGRDFRFERRYANYEFDAIPGIMRDLLNLKITLLVVGSTISITVARQLVHTVPIVFTMASDPVGNGIVDNLHKPGGNITGVFTLNTFVDGKRVQLFRELLPSLEKVALLTNPNSPKFNETVIRDVRAAAQSLGMEVIVLDVRSPAEFDAAFQRAVSERADGMVVSAESIFIINPSELQILAARHHLPTIYADNKPVQEGGLISYGTDQDEAYRLVGIYAARILKGEQPQNMPVQQSTTTRLAINLKTARDLGINIPPMLLSRADEVIE